MGSDRPTIPCVDIAPLVRGTRLGATAASDAERTAAASLDLAARSAGFFYVTGHGVGAALLTHAAQAAIRSYLELVPDLGEVVSRLNNRLVEAVEPGVFISLILFVVDTKAHTLSYVNAGHPPLFLVRDGELVEYEKTGMVLGVV